jgi:gas vesicle protein
MTNDRSKWGHPVSVFCMGLGVGAVLGILFAPKSGKETRKDIAGSVSNGFDQVRARTAGVVQGAQQFVSQTKENLEDAVHAGTKAIEKHNDPLVKLE